MDLQQRSYFLAIENQIVQNIAHLDRKFRKKTLPLTFRQVLNILVESQLNDASEKKEGE